MPYQGIGVALIGYLQEHANQVVTIDQLSAHFKDRFERSQILSNMANLMKTSAGEPVERLQTGMWRYTAPTKQDRKPITTIIFEQLRELPNGGHLLLGEDGELYRATRIKL